MLSRLAAALLLAGSAMPAFAQPPAPAATLQVAPLQYSVRQLPNGLRVYAMRDPDTANVAVQMWYNVGGKDDPAGRSGFAHLFEHIMFKATRNMPAETFDRLTEDVGGYNNASTNADYTNYYEVVPANHLQRILWAEAERMGALVIDQATFASERDVVKEELRQRVLASPYGPLFYLYLPQTGFSVHPYGRPVIGSIADLDAATVDDVEAFHATWYRPDNAVLVVAGNFDPLQLDAWVDRYFGPIARPDRPIPRVTAVEPPATAPRIYDVYQANVPLPAVAISFPQPRATSPDLPALMVLDAILADGKSSRLYQTMVYEQKIAAEVLTQLEATQDPGRYAIGAIMSDGKTPEQGLASLDAQLARLRDAPVTAAELDEARNEIVTATICGRETADGRASELADAVIRYGDAAYADKLLAAVQAVTAADVQRVARTILDDRTRVVIRYRPEQGKTAGAHADTIVTASTIAAPALAIAGADVPAVSLAPIAERVQPPAPATPVAAHIPAVFERTLANGLRVVVAPARALPLVSVDLRVAGGSAADPTGRAGVADLTAELLTQGTTTRSATQIAGTIEAIGAELAAGADDDDMAVTLQARADRIDPALAVMADVVRNPVFAEPELARVRTQALDALSVAMSDPGEVAGLAMPHLLFGQSGYGAVASAKSLKAITRADVSGFHRARWRPDAAAIVITGDISEAQGFALAERYFGDWKRPAAPPPAKLGGAAPSPAVAPQTLVIDLPGTGQAAVAMGFRGTSRGSGSWFPLLVANDVLGGGYSARLNLEIRIRRGLSYGAGSAMDPRLGIGPVVLTAQTRNDAAVQVVGLMETELARLGKDLPGDGELAARKASLVGAFGRAVETNAGLADELGDQLLFGLPPARLGDYVASVEAVTAEQARAVAGQYLAPGAASLIVSGDAAVFYDALRTLRPDARRVPATALDLDGPAPRH